MQWERWGNADAPILLIQPVDEHDLEEMESELSLLSSECGADAFGLWALRVDDWNRDLSPWEAPPVFGKMPFGGAAKETLAVIFDEVKACPEKTKIVLGGYSLAGLFALWAGTQTERFCGIAAASPSVWYPDFTDYLEDHPMRAAHVYLSLGDKEEKAKNPVMARVGTAIVACERTFREKQQRDCVLEWNEGNHFKDAGIRSAKAFSWVVNRLLRKTGERLP